MTLQTYALNISIINTVLLVLLVLTLVYNWVWATDLLVYLYIYYSAMYIYISTYAIFFNECIIVNYLICQANNLFLIMSRPCALIYKKEFLLASDDHIPTNNRNSMVYSLIEACGLFNKVDIIKPQKANFDQLHCFHSWDYLCFLKENSVCVDDEDDKLIEYGFGYDCPLRPGLFDYCLEIAGGSVTAASLLCKKDYRIAINWYGGWHHAKIGKAAGYCYVNDCVLAILQLRKSFKKVLYIDLDLHHGDGVEDAFCGTDKVMTFSVHKHELGFFPGTGSINNVGFGKGKYFTVNLPVKDGIQDDGFIFVCSEVLLKIKEQFLPDAIVCQVGVDGLNGDPMRSFNLTPVAFEKCLKLVLSWDLPTLILGGGGYNEANTARCWTQITASIANASLPDDIPEHNFFPLYGPDFNFKIEKSYKKDMNTKEFLNQVIESVTANLDKL